MSLFNKIMHFHPIQSIKEVFTSLKWSRQRRKKGYCEYDLYSISDWFIKVVSDMIDEIRLKRLGIPNVLMEDACKSYDVDYTKDFFIAPEDVQDKIEKEVNGKWDEILTRMAFLLRESHEDTCSKKNTYEEEYNKAREEFTTKYGDFGEKLLTEEDKEHAKKTGGRRAYFMYDLPAYAEISNNYFEEEDELREYREACQKEGLAMFVKWFAYLGI